jgi:hypothetical protein
MRITFTKTGTNTYTTRAARADGVELSIPAYDRSSALPHDFAHFVVEQSLGLRGGFWGKVSRGALFPSVAVLAGRQPPHAADRSKAIVRESGQSGIEAEEFVGVLRAIVEQQLDRDLDRAAVRMRRMWRPADTTRSPVSRDELAHVCAALRAATASWKALGIGSSIAVVWPEDGLDKRRGQKRHLTATGADGG